MRSLLGFFILFSSIVLQAKVTQLTCEFPQLGEGHLIISVNNIEDAETVELNSEAFTNYEGEPTAYSYQGEAVEWLWMLANSWDGYSVSRVSKDRLLEFYMDSDGCDNGGIYLYANSGFRYGYLKLKHGCSGPGKANTFSLVRCLREDQK